MMPSPFGDLDLITMCQGPLGTDVVRGDGPTARRTRGIFTEFETELGASREALALTTDAADLGRRRAWVAVPTLRFTAGEALAGLTDDTVLHVAGRRWRARLAGTGEDGRLTIIGLAAC